MHCRLVRVPIPSATASQFCTPYILIRSSSLLISSGDHLPCLMSGLIVCIHVCRISGIGRCLGNRFCIFSKSNSCSFLPRVIFRNASSSSSDHGPYTSFCVKSFHRFKHLTALRLLKNREIKVHRGPCSSTKSSKRLDSSSVHTRRVRTWVFVSACDVI